MGALHVYLLGLAEAGCTPRPGAPVEEPRGANTTLFVEIPLDVVQAYFFRAEIAVQKVDPPLRLDWLRSRDVQERSLWVQRYRNSEMTLGEVIATTTKDREAVWMVETKTTPAKAAPAVVVPPVPPPPPKVSPQKRPGGAHSCRTTKDGKKICQKYNGAGCAEPCPVGELHVCAAMLKNGRACAIRGHKISECRNKKRKL